MNVLVLGQGEGRGGATNGERKREKVRKVKAVHAAEEQVGSERRWPSDEGHCVPAATAVQSFTPSRLHLGDSHLVAFVCVGSFYLVHGEEIVEDALQLVLLHTPVLWRKRTSTIHHTPFDISLTLRPLH